MKQKFIRPRRAVCGSLALVFLLAVLLSGCDGPSPALPAGASASEASGGEAATSPWEAPCSEETASPPAETGGEETPPQPEPPQEAALYTWDLTPALTTAFLAEVTYDPADYTTSEIDGYAPPVPLRDNASPVGLTLELPAGTLVRDGYRQEIGGGAVTLYNDVPGRVTPCAVLDASGRVIASVSLAPVGTVRWIRCETARNVRDLGGWACDGGTVRFGLLLRGGEPGAGDAEVLVGQCGVRHELQLRGRAEAPQPGSLPGVGYTCAEEYVWYTVEPESWDAWRTNLGCVFACVGSGEPVYFHCFVGADRTGTLACVLEALLGVSQSDIDKEYELTNFYSGTSPETVARRRNEVEVWAKLIAELREIPLPAEAEDSLRNHAVQFALDLGFSAEEINAYRAAMIDGTPPEAVYGVRLAGDPASLAEPTTGVLAGAAFTNTLRAARGRAFGAVTVTMGGEDVTSAVYDPATGAIRVEAVTGELLITATVRTADQSA